MVFSQHVAVFTGFYILKRSQKKPFHESPIPFTGQASVQDVHDPYKSVVHRGSRPNVPVVARRH